MGFLDNLKEAMKAGAEAAENYRERELAKQEQNNPVKQHPEHPADPAAPFNFTAKTEEPVIVTDPKSGAQVKFNILSNGRAKLDDPSAYEGRDYKAVVRETVLGTVTATLNDPSFLPDAKDPKTLILLSNRLIPIVTGELKSKGITAAFKMLNVTHDRG